MEINKKEKENSIKKIDRKKIYMIIFVLLEVFLCCFHYYNDISVTAKHGMSIWSSIFSGRFFHFFEDSLMASGNAYFNAPQYASYPLSVYLIFAIWEFPIWLAESLFKINLYNTLFGYRR